MKTNLLLIGLLFFSGAEHGLAEATSRRATTKPGRIGAAAEKPLEGHVEDASVTEGTIRIGETEIPYRATAATMPMKDEHDKLKATVFFVAYERLSEDDASTKPTEAHKTCPNTRPLTFVFNGGPGAASVWLHLGAVGPKRIALADDGAAPPPPYRLVDNNHSWLDATDLVFIDPVGTGFSRPAKGEKGEQFYGVKEDVKWVADFIRLYATQYERWLSPTFLAGESYGTTRAAGLSEYLLDRYGIALNGIILISPVLDYQTIMPGQGNDLPYALYLPTYTAAACYHKKLAADLRADLGKTLKEVRAWALGSYLTALAKGADLRPAERDAVTKHLHRYTSLPTDFIDRSDLRIQPRAFRKRLLADEQKIIGRFDGRITGFDPKPTMSWPTYDPSLSRYFAVYSSGFNDYVRRTLEYKSTLPYEVLSDRVRPWKFGENGLGYLSVADNLRSAMVKNPNLKVLVATGHYDLATPFFAADYTMSHLEVGKELRSNIRITRYEGGHMMYHNQPSLRKLKKDVAPFLRSATNSP